MNADDGHNVVHFVDVFLHANHDDKDILQYGMSYSILLLFMYI